MPPRMVVLATIAALVLSAPAGAQEPPPSLFESAPAQDAGTATPSDGGRSTVLIGLALAALAGAGLLAVLAIRRPSVPRTNTEIVDEALAAMAAGETPAAEPVSPPEESTQRFRRRRVKAARAASIEASAAARRGMPLIVEPPEPKCAWRPRVVAEPPLPAFGPGAHAGSPSVPPPPD